MRIFLFLAILCSTITLFGQTVEQNLDKYWQYRHKLVTHYMLIGDEQGYSLPASYINPGLERMKWSDNTIWLGWYIGTLATEYHLLHNPRYKGYSDGDSTARRQQNLNELYYALKALIRLDEDAETFFDAPCISTPNQRNGFFLRDDVPASITDSFPGYQHVDSDYEEHSYANEMSQDQAYHVLLGLSLVKRFLPDSVEVNGFNIHEEAVDQGLLIGAWIHQDGWLIKNPACSNKNVDRGHDATLLSKGLNAALGYISDGGIDYSSDITSLYATVWDNLKSQPALLTADNLHMTMTLAAIGEGWGSGTLNDLMVLADTNKWYAYPLLYIALRDTSSVSNYQQHKQLIYFWTDSMLNEAPITGPLSTYPNQNGHGYGVNNRFIRPRVNHYAGINPNEAGHQWNGLDYMLLHNLQLIVDPNKWPEQEVVDTTGIGGIQTWKATIFPNPSSGRVTVIVPASFQGTLRLLNMDGQAVLTMPVSTPQMEMDLDMLPHGVYIAIFAADNGGTYQQRLVLLPHQ